MSDWRYVGPAVRRRAGAPSNHYDSVGARGRVSLPTPEEALAGMAAVGSPRVPMGTSMVHDFINRSGAPLRGDLVGRGNTQTNPSAVYEDQTVPPAMPGIVKQVPPAGPERIGASYHITVAVPAPMLAEAAATQANGRIVTSRLPRENDFGEAMVNSRKNP